MGSAAQRRKPGGGGPGCAAGFQAIGGAADRGRSDGAASGGWAVDGVCGRAGEGLREVALSADGRRYGRPQSGGNDIEAKPAAKPDPLLRTVRERDLRDDRRNRGGG